MLDRRRLNRSVYNQDGEVFDGVCRRDPVVTSVDVNTAIPHHVVVQFSYV